MGCAQGGVDYQLITIAVESPSPFLHQCHSVLLNFKNEEHILSMENNGLRGSETTYFLNVCMYACSKEDKKPSVPVYIQSETKEALG